MNEPTALKTKERLINAAASLLDQGGERAVTLRAVGQAAGVSQNAAYKHFEDRSALLAAVVIRDFRALMQRYDEARRSESTPPERLHRALEEYVDFGQKYPERYRLLMSDPAMSARGGELKEAAMATYWELNALVRGCQETGYFRAGQTEAMTGLLVATMHGLLDLRAGGRMNSEKGLTSVMTSMDVLLGLLAEKAVK